MRPGGLHRSSLPGMDANEDPFSMAKSGDVVVRDILPSSAVPYHQSGT
jgi:hypothetical protein